MSSSGWGIDIRWARGEAGWLELRDPTDGRVHVVWSRDCPPWWRRVATVRAKAERAARDREPSRGVSA